MVLRADQKTTAGPSHDPDCPFCKGNEDQTSEPLLQIGTKKDWSLRIVKNKYPALTPPEGDMATSGILCDAIQIGSFSRRFTHAASRGDAVPILNPARWQARTISGRDAEVGAVFLLVIWSMVWQCLTCAA